MKPSGVTEMTLEETVAGLALVTGFRIQLIPQLKTLASSNIIAISPLSDIIITVVMMSNIVVQSHMSFSNCSCLMRTTRYTGLITSTSLQLRATLCL